MTRDKITVVDGGKSTPSRKRGDGGGTTLGSDWRDGLTRNREQQVEGTLHNVMMILEHDPKLRGMFWLNEFSNQILLAREPCWPGGNTHEFVDTDSCELSAWLQNPDTYGARCRDDTVHKAVVAVARRYKRHPVREYLEGLEWDGVPRVERMLVDIFGAADTPYNRRTAECFMVGAVARILWADPKQPFVGAQVDFMLVFEGDQGRKKSTSMRTLFSSPWFVETNESPTGKDFYQVIQGCWGVEIAEMDSFGKADVTAVKTAITRRVDKFRPPYDRVPRSYRRECVFVGTTNEHEYLRDPTGARRFLPVATTGAVALDRLAKDRDQLWAEAVRMFRDGFQWWELPKEAVDEQEARYIADSWEGRLSRWLAKKMPGDESKIYPERLRFTSSIGQVTTDEILQYCMAMDPGKHGISEQMRVSRAMKRLGWRTERVQVNGVRERRWCPPPVSIDDGQEGDDVPF